MSIAIQSNTDGLLNRLKILERNFYNEVDVDNRRYFFNVAYIVYSNYKYNKIYDVNHYIIDAYLEKSRFFQYVMRVRDSAENNDEERSTKELLESEMNLVYKHLENVQKLIKNM